LDGGSFDDIRFDDKDLVEIKPGLWQVDVPFSYEGAENVAEGDLEDDIAPAFPALMRAKSIYGAEYEFHVVVGGKHANPFGLRSHIIAMIAALGGSVLIHRLNDHSNDFAEQAGSSNGG
jgi:hypothetical protein